MEMNELSIGFHQNIRARNFKHIDNFIETYPTLKIVVIDGNSSVALALKCEHIDVYETLISNGFRLGLNENF